MKKLLMIALLLVGCAKNDNAPAESEYEQTTSYACAFEKSDTAQKCSIFGSHTCTTLQIDLYTCVSNLGDVCPARWNTDKNELFSTGCKIDALDSEFFLAQYL